MAVLGGYRITRTGILFIAGIIVLGGLVTGGVFLVKNHGEAVRREQAVKVAEQNLKDQSKTAVGTTGSSNTTAVATNTDSTQNPSELPVTGIDEMQFLERAAILAVLALSVSYFVTARIAVRRTARCIAVDHL